MKKLHICYLGDITSVHTMRWVKFFKNKGYKVSIISFMDPSERPENETYKLNFGKFGKFQYFLAIPKVKALLKDLKPDILHAIYIGGYGFLASQTDFHPLVLSALGSDVLIKDITSNPIKILILEKFLKRTIYSADFVHCQAQHLADEIISRYGYPRKKVVAFPYGVDLERFAFRKDKSNLINPIVISTRYFEDIYNVELLIQTIPLVLELLPQTKFVLIGGGSKREKIEKLISSLGVQQSVKVYGKITDEFNFLNLLMQGNIYVSTSLTDGASQSLLEAMAIGLFPVVTDIVANREWIINGKNGLLCSVNSPRDLAEKIIIAFKNRDLRVRAQEKNLEIIRERGDFFKNMLSMEKKYLELYESQFSK